MLGHRMGQPDDLLSFTDWGCPKITTPVEIVSGRTVCRNLVLHRRDQSAELTVCCDDEDRTMFVTAFVEQGKLLWHRSRNVHREWPSVFNSFPAGACSLTARGSRMYVANSEVPKTFFSMIRAPLNSARQKIYISARDTGSVELNIRGLCDSEISELGVRVTTRTGGMTVNVCQSPSMARRDGNPSLTSHPVLSTTDGGSWRISGLGAGTYSIAVAGSDHAYSAGTKVRTAKQSIVKFNFDAEGKLISE